MKIVCNNCSTKYSIADDKVADGLYQTPCKRCGATLIIRGASARVASAEAPASLRSERRETSLLFSLNSLAGSADIGTQQAAASGRVENSGLLDIRRMAAAYQNQPTAAAPAASAHDLCVPVAVPPPILLTSALSGSRAGRRRPMLWVLGGATGMAAVATALLAVMFLRGGIGNDAQASTSKPEIALERADLATGTDPAPAIHAPEVPAHPLVAVIESQPKTQPEVEKPRETQTRERRRRRHVETETETETETTRQPKEPKEPKGCLDEVACLLASNPPACCRKYLDQKERPEPTNDREIDPKLPQKLGRGDIKDSMSTVLPRVTACGSRSSAGGKVTISIKVSGDGKVSSATVKEAPNAALGTCVADAVKKARFARTQQGASFAYPFMF